MRFVFTNPQEARKVGKVASSFVRSKYNFETIAHSVSQIVSKVKDK